MSETINNYEVLREGGRVKSAGFPMDDIFRQGQIFTDDPGPESALEVSRAFQEMRSTPPPEFRARFFPMEGREIKALLRETPAFYRPILKTDQGAGKFLGFRVGEEDGSLRFQVSKEEGYVIEEAYFSSQLSRAGYPEDIIAEIEAVRKHFQEQNLPEARLAFERLQIASEQDGMLFRRDAQVGRNALMFIHPAKSAEGVKLSTDLLSRIEDQVNEKLLELFDLSEAKKREFAKQHGLPDRSFDESNIPFYLQVDVHIMPDGEITIAELQVPDVGLFLNGLKTNEEDILRKIQGIVKPIKEKVIDKFVQAIESEGEKPIYLVTRSDVIDQEEDVLEIKELEEVQNALKDRGFSVEVISAIQASELDSDSLLFIFNLDPNSEEFTQLARSYLTKEYLRMVPSPFVRAAERDITGYNRVEMSTKQIANLRAIVGEVASIDKPEKVYTQLMAVDNFLRQLGIEEEALHFYHPAIPTPIPAYRYDIRSLHIASKIIADKGLSNVVLRSIPISPDRGVLLDQDGGALYATFRFMFLRS